MSDAKLPRLASADAVRTAFITNVLPFLTTADAVRIRASCKDLRECVSGFPWQSMNHVPGSLVQ